MEDANGLALYTELLGLAEFEVVHSDREAGGKVWHLTIVPRMTVGLCPHCGRVSAERHGCHPPREILDLPTGACLTKLHLRLWQFHCAACGQFFTPHYQAIAEGTHATERLLARMAEMIGFSDIRNAARFFGVAEKTLERWYYEFLERQRKHSGEANQPIRSLGIDELSLKKSTDSSARC
jgi:transposase